MDRDNIAIYLSKQTLSPLYVHKVVRNCTSTTKKRKATLFKFKTDYICNCILGM